MKAADIAIGTLLIAVILGIGFAIGQNTRCFKIPLIGTSCHIALK